MSWTDKKSLENIKHLRDDFFVPTFIETGTFKGVNARVQSYNFQWVFTCEVVKEYYLHAVNNRLKNINNVMLVLMSSPKFLTFFENFFRRTIIYYLDAHFYDPKLPIEKRFVIQEELKTLKDNYNCIIIIHDFDNGELGCIEYDNIKMGMNVVGDLLFDVNPNFHFYTNSKSDCDIVTLDDVANHVIPGVENDEDIIDNINYAWTKPEKTYRGMLYCTPKKLELSKYNLRRFQYD